MTTNEFEYLCSQEARALIEQHIYADPMQLALKGVPAAICSQVKYLQRCKKKLPLHYKKRCIIPSLSYEQSSSHATASSKGASGEVCIDLTCGLGVDTLHFSHNFKRVITIERDPLLCAIARYNFQLLEAANIEVVNTTAADYLSSLEEDVDMIYVDPARRDATKKVFLLEECSPDMNLITKEALSKCKLFMVKLSPLFDVDMAFNFFREYGTPSVGSVSLGDECKEVIVKICKEVEEESLFCVVISSSNLHEYTFPLPITKHNEVLYKAQEGDFLYIPDVAFYKSRTTHALMQHYYHTTLYRQESQNAAIFSSEKIEEFEGERYKIKSIHPYKKKELKKLLKGMGSKVKLLKKEFPLSSAQIKRELSISDGAHPILLFTSLEGKSVAIELEELHGYQQC